MGQDHDAGGRPPGPTHGDAQDHAGEACDGAGAPPSPAQVPPDFTPVSDLLPDWVDIKAVCKDAKRFVALHALSQFDVLAINDGQRVYTTNDRDGEFRRRFHDAVDGRGGPGTGALTATDTLVYDCESRRQWLATRPAAIRFLNLQV